MAGNVGKFENDFTPRVDWFHVLQRAEINYELLAMQPGAPGWKRADSVNGRLEPIRVLVIFLTTNLAR